MTDPIADLLIRIKNASLANLKTVTAPYSKVKESLAVFLQKGGFLEKVEVSEKEKKKKLILTLIQHKGKTRHIEVKRISKPGRRVYVKAKDLAVLKRGRGTIILSSPKGLVTADEALKRNLGGEVVCRII